MWWAGGGNGDGGAEKEGEEEPPSGIGGSDWGDWGVWDWGDEVKDELEAAVMSEGKSVKQEAQKSLVEKAEWFGLGDLEKGNKDRSHIL